MDIPALAKINLFLHVTGQRPDGYHTLYTLMACVDLADIITLEPGQDTVTVACEHPGVPSDPTNLAYRAADLFFRRTGIDEGVTITIDKRIPVAAGLGGGSSDAAAVLRGLNRQHGNPLSKKEMTAMAAGIGADVPFFISGEAALAGGIGDQLTPYRLLSPLPVVLVTPEISVSTAEVYKSMNLGLTNNKNPSMIFNFTKDTRFDAGRHLKNDLERVTTVWHPEIERIKNELKRQGAVGALMTGSGPGVFGVFEHPESAARAGRKMAECPKIQVVVTQIASGAHTI